MVTKSLYQQLEQTSEHDAQGAKAMQVENNNREVTSTFKSMH
jgi:hypothetical protein